MSERELEGGTWDYLEYKKTNFSHLASKVLSIVNLRGSTIKLDVNQRLKVVEFLEGASNDNPRIHRSANNLIDVIVLKGGLTENEFQEYFRPSQECSHPTYCALEMARMVIFTAAVGSADFHWFARYGNRYVRLDMESRKIAYNVQTMEKVLIDREGYLTPTGRWEELRRTLDADEIVVCRTSDILSYIESSKPGLKANAQHKKETHNMAIERVERIYRENSGKYLKKNTLRDWVCTNWDLSKREFDDVIWKSASIELWKRGGSREGKVGISKTDLSKYTF